MADLVTIGEAMTFLSLDDSCDTGKLGKLIDYVSAAVQSYIGRTIAEAEYREWYNGNGTDVMRLSSWPVTRIYQVTAECQNLGRLDYTGSAAESFASCDGSVLTLVDSSAHDLTLSSYPTGTTLKAAVDALDGWTLSLYTAAAGNLDTRKLRPFSDYANNGNQTDLEVPEDSMDARMSNRSEWLLEGSFPAGSLNVFVWYKAGYASTPDALKFTVLQILRDVWFSTKANRDLTRDSESLGDYSYKNAGGSSSGSGLDLTHIVASYGQQLSAFMRVEMA